MRWITVEAAIDTHRAVLDLTASAASVRDRGLLESALMRPQNAAAYGEPDLGELAAMLMYGIIKNHPFVDGNKRAALVIGSNFCRRNGFFIDFTDDEAAEIMVEVASGQLTEEQLALCINMRLKIIDDEK